jgi:hypothetical protein
MRTVVTIVRGNNILLKEAPMQIVPREGENLRMNHLRYKVVKVEHTISNNPDVHSVHVFVR